MTIGATLKRIAFEARLRRIAYLVMAIVLAILCVVPRPYVARAKLLPQDSNSAGLGQILNSVGGQLSSFANLLTGGKPPNDLYLVVGRSSTVVDEVIATLKLAGPGRPYTTVDEARLALSHKVNVQLLLGGVLEIEVRTRDPEQSQRITEAYITAISHRIGALGRETLQRKTRVVESRFSKAGARVAEASRKLDAFRAANKLAEPTLQLGSAIALRTQLQASLAAKQVELEAAQRFAGPENPRLIEIQSEIASIQTQISAAGRDSSGPAGPNLTGLSELQSRYLSLYRDYRFAQALYEVYARASEQTAVENLVAEGSGYVQIIEAAHIDAERHYNIPAVALLLLVIVSAAFTELYVPLTGLEWRHVFGRAEP